MSLSDEDDEGLPLPKKQRIYFGSLEEGEKERLAQSAKEEPGEVTKVPGKEEESEGEATVEPREVAEEAEEEEGSDENTDNEGEDSDKGDIVELPQSIAEGIKFGNIDISQGETFELSVDTFTDRQQELLAEFEKRKRARAIAVPTDDTVVKARLRELGHPICLFGEGPSERRDRLRELLVGIEDLLPGIVRDFTKEDIAKEALVQEVWYHEGPEELRNARFLIAEYSLPRARDRINASRTWQSKPESEKAAKKQELNKRMGAMTNFCSQIGDDRPLSYCQFSPNGKMLVTGSWSGLSKLWSVPDGEYIKTLRGHDERVSAVVFHPRATIDQDRKAVNLVSCSSDGSVLFWNLDSDTPIGDLKGHSQRVSRLAFHPSARFLGTACFDCSWRLWDLELEREVLHQEGHSRECYDIAFQSDGALVATCGFDARGLIWDLRTGRNIMGLDGHQQKVVGIDFATNGYQIATGSEDQKIMVWDLRRQKNLYTIPAHTNLISHLKFHDGFLLTTSYDNSAKAWSHPGWTPLQSMRGHEQKVTCGDISPDGNLIATASFDRTFKLWGPDYLV